jgi:hypothetical protein
MQIRPVGANCCMQTDRQIDKHTRRSYLSLFEILRTRLKIHDFVRSEAIRLFSGAVLQDYSVVLYYKIIQWCCTTRLFTGAVLQDYSVVLYYKIIKWCCTTRLFSGAVLQDYSVVLYYKIIQWCSTTKKNLCLW